MDLPEEKIVKSKIAILCSLDFSRSFRRCRKIESNGSISSDLRRLLLWPFFLFHRSSSSSSSSSLFRRQQLEQNVA